MSKTLGTATRRAILVGIAGLALTATVANAQTAQPAPPGAAGSTVVEASSPRETLLKMTRRVTIELTEQRLEDVMTFLREFTGADIEPLWGTDGGEGLDKDMLITMKVSNLPAMDFLERLLAKAQPEFGTGNSWQMTTDGTMQAGPKELLNKEKRVELYDIHDLLFIIPTYDEVPQIDLQSLLQQSQSGGGGGGGQSPFRDDEGDAERETKPLSERAQEIIDILIQLVEPDQWVENGGEAATIRYYQGSLLVNAPDYIHRQINGYKYWPSHSLRVSGGRRYVSLDMDNGIGTVDGFAVQPVTAVVPGAGGGGGGGPGGGGAGPGSPGGPGGIPPAAPPPRPRRPR
jgi:hypothetical protein